MKNTNLAFYALAGISSMPATLTAGQAIRRNDRLTSSNQM